MARWALLLLRDHFLTFLGCGGGLDRQEALPSDWYGWDGHGTRPDGPGPILECGLPVPCLGWLFLWEPGGDSHLPGRTGRQGQRGVCLQFSGSVLCPGPHCRAVPGWLGFPCTLVTGAVWPNTLRSISCLLAEPFVWSLRHHCLHHRLHLPGGDIAQKQAPLAQEGRP